MHIYVEFLSLKKTTTKKTFWVLSASHNMFMNYTVLVHYNVCGILNHMNDFNDTIDTVRIQMNAYNLKQNPGERFKMANYSLSCKSLTMSHYFEYH